MTKEELQAIKARLAAAMPGPWTIKRGRYVVSDRLLYDVDTSCVYGGDNLVFIAHAPEDVAALIAEVERLERWKSEALEVIGGLQELGHVLGLRPGESVTGQVALEKARELRSQIDNVRTTVAEEIRLGMSEYEGQLIERAAQIAEGRYDD